MKNFLIGLLTSYLYYVAVFMIFGTSFSVAILSLIVYLIAYNPIKNLILRKTKGVKNVK